MSNVKRRTSQPSAPGAVATSHIELDYSSFGSSNTIDTMNPEALMLEVLGGVMSGILHEQQTYTETDQGPSEHWEARIVDILASDIKQGIEGYENAFRQTGLDQRGLSTILDVTAYLKSMVNDTAIILPVSVVRKLNSKFEQASNFLLALVRQMVYSIRFIRNDFTEKDDAQPDSDYYGEVEVIHDGNTWVFEVAYVNKVRSTVFYVDGYREPKVSKSAEAIGMLFQTAAHFMIDREYEARRNRAFGKNTKHVGQAKQIASIIGGDYRDYVPAAKAAELMLAQVPALLANPAFAGREASLPKDVVTTVLNKQLLLKPQVEERIVNIFLTR